MVRQFSDGRIAIYTVNKDNFDKLTSFLGEDGVPLSNVSWSNLEKSKSEKVLVLKSSDIEVELD